MRFDVTIIALALLCGQSLAQDVIIYGGTPGGIASAIAAARMGSEVTLVEYHGHIGGILFTELIACSEDAHSAHNGNLITFHRVPNFRSLVN